MPAEYSIDDLDQAVRRHPAYLTLAAINRVSIEEDSKSGSEISKYFPGPKSEGHGPPVFTQHGLAFLARQSVVCSNDFRGTPPTVQNMLRLCSIYNNLTDPLLLAEPEDRYAIVRFLLTTAYEQFPMQENIRNFIARALYLFEVLPSELRGTRHAVDIDGIFTGLTGLGIRDFIRFGFVLWAITMKGRPLTRSELGRYPEKFHFFSHENATRFLRHVSTDYKEFRKAAAREEEGLAWRKQAFNSLVEWPILRPDAKALGDFIVPVPKLLLSRVTNGLYYDFLNPSLDAGLRGQFLTFFGDLFQAYVGRLLSAYYSSAELFEVRPYGRGQKTVDWIVVEGDSAILFECKAKRFTKVSKRIADQEEVSRDLRLALTGGVQQLYDTASAILSKAEGLEPFHGIRQTLPVLVLAEPMYLANSPIVRDLVKDQFPEVQADFSFQTISVRELEYLIPWRAKSTISSLLAKKFQAPASTWDLGAFLQENPDPGQGHKALDAVLDEFMGAINIDDSGSAQE